jgi:hypothetical protein
MQREALSGLRTTFSSVEVMDNLDRNGSTSDLTLSTSEDGEGDFGLRQLLVGF